MPISYNSNIQASSTIRGMNRNSEDLFKSYQRLASGLRINAASDDAAGLAVASGLQIKSRVLSRGKLNVEDGISAFEIINGAATEISSMLTRMSELAQQSANGIFTKTQRRQLDKEYQALDLEIQRIAASTKYNGLNLLKGDKVTNTSTKALFSNLFGAVNVTRPSGDGRYVTRQDGAGNIYQVDTQTNSSTLIAATGSSGSKVVQSADGKIVVYTSGNNLFKYSRDTGETTQLTSALVAESYTLDLSADGETLAFASKTHYVDNGTLSSGTTSGNQRIFTVNLTSGVFRTVASDVTSLSDLFVSSDGSRVAFKSALDLVGSNADLNNEVYSINFDSATASFSQVTNTTSGGQAVKGISNSGVIYFKSNADIGGQNPSGYQNIFKYDPSSGNITNVSNNTAANALYGESMSADGSSFFFATKSDITGENSGGKMQFFRYESLSNVVTQTTNFSTNLSIDTGTIKFSYDGHSALVSLTSITTDFALLDLTPSNYSFDIEAGEGRSGKLQSLLGALNGSVRGLGGYAISSQSSAQGTLSRINSSIDELGTYLGKIGAYSSRLSHARDLLSAVTQEYSAANSRITDIDVASETATLLKRKIIQDAGVAILAQANQQPEIALRLLM